MTAARARQILGLAQDANDDAVMRAFRSAVKAVHPDRPGGDPERLRLVIEAHRLLQSLAQTRMMFTPAPRPARPKPAPPLSLRLQISASEALFGGERRIALDPERLIDVQLPAGLRAGDTLRLPGAGRPQDVLLRIGVAAGQGLTVRRHDLWLELLLDQDQLSAGQRLEIDTPRGRRALTIPSSAGAGGIVRLKGEGLPARASHPPGDLIIRLAVRALPDETPARNLLRRFASRWAA